MDFSFLSLTEKISRIQRRLLHALDRWGVHPNHITIAGTLFQCFAGWLFYRGLWLTGGLVLLGASTFDILDGALARAGDKESRFGAFLDSTLDRVSDMALFGGLLAGYAGRGCAALAVVALYGLVTSVLISYAKARAENLMPDCTVGLAQRPERITLLIAGGLFRSMPLGLGLIALFNTLTVSQRILSTYWSLEGRMPRGRFCRRTVFLDFGRDSRAYRILAGVTLVGFATFRLLISI